MLVFVYGTLMKGFANHGILEDSLFLSKGMTRGKLYHLPQGYPALVDGDGWIKGEVYEVNDNTLKEMDILEDYYGDMNNNLYNRVRADAALDNKTIANVYLYMYVDAEEAETTGVLIPEGSWSEYMKTLYKKDKTSS